ncbi:hypothetical protein WICMUC_000112 [Wickerhamomyces mucosus]|uniref:RRM domain-containing protein n=1 Tax=Wickerhamomyces mucosus TaxID=1378264 RepID=A0A9P8TJ55_9ASCO|nr:hypothetical protein WICMUC_000112 [Wickerhamomyces mucosus]
MEEQSSQNSKNTSSKSNVSGYSFRSRNRDTHPSEIPKEVNFSKSEREKPYEKRDRREYKDEVEIKKDNYNQHDSNEYKASRDQKYLRNSRDARDIRDTKSDFRDHKRDTRGDYSSQRGYREREYQRRDYESRDRRVQHPYERRREEREYRGTYLDRREPRREYGRDRGRADHYKADIPYTKSDSFTRSDLTSVIPIDKLKRNSKWDLKPKGFEKVSSEKAKISGFFPLPGEKRKVDVTKLEGLVSSGDLAQGSILFDTIDIDPYSSKLARILKITDVEFTLFPIDKLIEALNNYIKDLKDEDGFIITYELRIQPRVNKQFLVVEFSNTSLTNIIYSLSEFFKKQLNLKSLSILRPDSYIVLDEDVKGESREKRGKFNDESFEDEDEEDEDLSNSVNKIAISNVPAETTLGTITALLTTEVDEVIKIKPILSKEESRIKNLVFVEFKSIANEEAIRKINSLRITDAQLSAIECSNSKNIQKESVTYRNFPQFIKSQVPWETNVLVLLNLVKPESLRYDDIFNVLYEDVSAKLSEFGKVDRIVIPRPDSPEYKRTFKNIDKNIGKIYVKFENTKDAKVAKDNLNGSKYNERTIIIGFANEADFDLNIF